MQFHLLHAFGGYNAARGLHFWLHVALYPLRVRM